MQGKKFDLLILFWLSVIGLLYAYIFRNDFIGKPLIGAALILTPSILYLGKRKKKNWKKIAVSTLVFGGLCGFLFEFVMEYTRSYNVAVITIPYKIFGVLPIDNIIAHMMMACLTVTFYEHFIDREVNPYISKHLKYALLPAVFAIVAEITIFFTHPTWLNLRYPYFYLGICAILPTFILGYTKPKFIKNMLETAVYFFSIYFMLELMAITLNYWIYQGDNYIGWVTLSHFTFPIEEIFFWMLFYAASIVSYYELFVDEHTKPLASSIH